jgi:hypothetical protein
LILLALFFEKVFWHIDLFAEHGPLMVLALMLCLFGIQVLAVGLVGELLMRTHFESGADPVYRIERITNRSYGSEASGKADVAPVAAARRAGR